MKNKYSLIGFLSLLFFLENGCKTISITYKPNEWQQGFSMDIPTYKKVSYINGENDWIYIFRYDNIKDGKLIFVSYSYSSLSPYYYLLNEKIEKQYGDSVFVTNENGYKYLKRKEQHIEYTYNYRCDNGNVKIASGHGNPKDVLYEKMFFERLGLHHETYNIDTSSIQLLYQPDTLVYEGVDGDSSWKSIEIVGKIIVGYINVPLKEKRKFDKYLSTIKEIDRISLETDTIVKSFLAPSEKKEK